MRELKKTIGPAPCIDGKIKENTVWACLSEEEIDLFNRNVICRTYLPGESVFMEGATCKGLYFVEGGLVGVRKIDQDGQYSLIRLAAKGDTLGYRPFLAKQTHRAAADAVEDAKVCFIDASTVRRILQNNHELGLQFLERIAQALGEAEERLFEMAVLNVDTRIIHLLLLYHDQWGHHLEDGSVQMELPITRNDLASMVGAHPDSVARSIRKLESKGLMQVDGRLILIEEFDILAEKLQTDLTHFH